VNYDNSLVVTIAVTCYSWAPSSGVHLLACRAIFRPPHSLSYKTSNSLVLRNLHIYLPAKQVKTFAFCHSSFVNFTPISSPNKHRLSALNG